MAVLTWRNVDAPRGGDTGIAGLATAAGLLSKGTDGLSDALGKFGQQQTDLANNAAVQAASRLQSAGGLSGALGDGSLIGGLASLGVDPTRVDAKTLADIQKGVGDRVTNDLHSAQTQEAFLKGQYDLARTGKTQYDLNVSQRDQSAMTKAMPLLNEIALRRSQNDEAGARALENDPQNRALLWAVDPAKYGEISRGSLDAYSKTLGNLEKGTTFQNSQVDRQRSEQADALVNQITQAGGDNQAGNDILERSGADPTVKALVQQRLFAQKNGWNIVPSPVGAPNGNGVVGTGGSVSSGSGGGSSSAAASEFISKYGDAAQKAADALGTDANTVLGMWGNETGWGQHMAAPNNFGNIKQTDGGGVAARDNMLGTVSKYRQYDSPDAFANDFVANIKKNWSGSLGAGADTGKFAAGLRPGQKGGYAEDPAYASKLISASNMVSRLRGGAPAPSDSLAPGEENVSATPATNAIAKATAADFPALDTLRQDTAEARSLNDSLIAGSQQRDGQNIANTGIKAATYLAAQNDGSSAKEVAAKLTSDGGVLKGEDPNKVVNWITDIQQRSVQRNAENKAVAKLSAAAAGVVLASGDGVIKGGGIGSSLLSSLKPNTLNSGSYYDPAAADNLVGSFNAGSITKASAVTAENKQVQDSLTSAQKALDAVTDRITTAQQSAENAGREIPDDVKQRLAGEYQRAKARRDKAQEKLNGPNAQQTNVTAAAAKRNADDAAEAARQVRMRDAMNAAADPLKNPLLLGANAF
jgi:hypothetical protein